MPVVINGSTGISGVDGSAGTPAFQGSDTNTGIRFGTDIVSLVTGGSDRLYIDSSGRLGVGTSSPSYALDVISVSGSSIASRFRGNASGNNNTQIRFYGNNAATDQWAIGGSIATNDTGRDFHIYDIVAGQNRLAINSSGFVGIGSTAPACALMVAPQGSVLSGTGNNYAFYINPTSTGYVYLDALTGSTNNTSLVLRTYNNGTYNNLIQSISGNETTFSTAGTERARIDSSGRLLLGTSSVSNGGAGAFINRTAGTSGTSGLFKNGTWTMYSISGEPALVLSSNVNTSGISTASETARGGIGFEFINASEPTRFVIGTVTASSTPSPVTFWAEGTERMRIANTGYWYYSGIRSGAGTYALKWNASTGEITFDTSTRLVKENIQDLNYGLSTVVNLKPRRYFRTDDQKEEIGFIADEVIDAIPEIVAIGNKSVITRNPEDTEEIPLGVNYEKLTAVLTKALQEAISEIESLKARVAALESA